jgi:hypothetical protein
MSNTQKKPESAAVMPDKTQGARLSEEDLAYVTEHLSDNQLDQVAGAGGTPPCGCGHPLGEAGDPRKPLGEAL